jgi:outer membrane protein OmpA-like peptidoglycan-associated protein
MGLRTSLNKCSPDDKKQYTLNQNGMKTSMKLIVTLLVFGCLFVTQTTEAQILKKLAKKAEKAAERTVERRVERETEKKTDAALDSILEPGSEGKKADKVEKRGKELPQVENGENAPVPNVGLEEEGDNEVGFKRGNLVLYKDDFSQDAVGDFPAKWNTSLGGEVKKLKGFDSKFLKVPANSVINLETTKSFPDNFTIELDVIIPEDAPIRMAAIGLGKSVPKQVDYMLTDEDNIRLLFNSRADFNADALKYGTKNEALSYTYHEVNYKVLLNQSVHVALEINGRRIRMFVDGKKMVDLPTFYKPEFSNAFFVAAPTHGDPKSLENYFYISNVVIAETGTDVRSSVIKDLIEKGNFTTNDILFASGSDKIQQSSQDILNQIGEAMKSHPEAKFMIVGHTDSDGETNSNLTLSQKRAAAVKNYLVSNFNIGESDLKTSGKGESVPVADNSSAKGKAQNRRVEFIKM